MGHPGKVYSFFMYFTLQHAGGRAGGVWSGTFRVGFQVRVWLVTGVGTYSRAGEEVDRRIVLFQVT